MAVMEHQTPFLEALHKVRNSLQIILYYEEEGEREKRDFQIAVTIELLQECMKNEVDRKA